MSLQGEKTTFFKSNYKGDFNIVWVMQANKMLEVYIF